MFLASATHEKENIIPAEHIVNQNDMGVINVQNYVKENQRSVEDDPANMSREEHKVVNDQRVSTPIMAASEIPISKAASKLTADVGITFRPIGDKNFHETEIIPLLKEYYAKLPAQMKASFGPPEIITEVAMGAYDPHFLFLLSNNSALPVMDRVKGLVIFAQDTNVNKKPLVDEEAGTVGFARETKVLLHHITAIDDDL